MVTINIYVTIKGTSRIWLSIDVPKEMAGEEGTKEPCQNKVANF